MILALCQSCVPGLDNMPCYSHLFQPKPALYIVVDTSNRPQLVPVGDMR